MSGQNVKVKVQVYSLKTYHPVLHFTPWSLDLLIRVPYYLHGEHTVLQPFRRIELIVHIGISILSMFKCLFFKPHMEEYKKKPVNVLHRTYNITHINVHIIT